MKTVLKTIFLSMALFTVSTMAFAHEVLLYVTPGCEYCYEAKKLLNQYKIPYRTKETQYGSVPRLYVDGKYQGTGLDAVKSWVESNK